MKNKLGVVALSTLFFVAPAKATDLAEVYELALGADASLAAAQQTLEAAKLDLPLAQSAFKPFVNADGGLSYGYNNTKPEGSNRISYSNIQTQLGVSAGKKLIDPLAGIDVEKAEVAQQSAILNYELAHEALIQNTISGYLDVLAAVDNEELAKLEQQAIGRQLELSTQRLEVGLGTKTDQFDATARYQQSKAATIAAQSAIVDAVQVLEEYVGAPLSAGDTFAPLKTQDIAYDAQNDEQWLQAALDKNKAYRLASHQVEVSMLEVERTRKAKSLNVDAIGSWGFNDSSGGPDGRGNQNDNWVVGLNASYPLFQGGTIKTRQKQAGYQLNASKHQLDQVRREAQRNIKAAQRAVEVNKAQVKALAQSVAASENALDSKEEGFRAGVTTNLDVLDGQRDLFLAKRNYLQSRYAVINAIVSLERAAGDLTAQDIGLVNGWLEK